MTDCQITALNVDDDPDVLERMAAVIERDVYWLETVTARRASDGLAILSERDIDCIVAAYGLPDMDGVTFCETVRETHPDLPLILYADEGSEDIASAGIAAGVTAYVGTKPGAEQATDLLTHVRKAVDRARTRHGTEWSHTHLAAIAENTSEAMFMLDSEGHVVTWNAVAERINGYTAEEILTERYSVLYPDEAVEQGKPDRLLARAGEHGSVTDEGWQVRKDGTRFWAEVSITALDDDAGDRRGFTVVTRDMTGANAGRTAAPAVPTCSPTFSTPRTRTPSVISRSTPPNRRCTCP